jgi:hypothetical protein
LTTLWTFISAVIGVFTASALLGWLMFRAAKLMERDPRTLKAVAIDRLTTGTDLDAERCPVSAAFIRT